MESQTTGDIEAQIVKLQDERDQRKDKAREQPGDQPAINRPALKPNNDRAHDESERTGITGDTDLKKGSNVVVDAQVGSENVTSSLKSDDATTVLRHQQHQDEADTAGSIHSIQSPNTSAEPQEPVDNNQNPPMSSGEVRASDTYTFMEDFPNGVWWTRLDEDDGLSRSLDFGSNGFTASLNTGHEILQMTAPDHRYGLVYARGSYADNPDAILARAQRTTGGKSTFGLKWSDGNPHTYRRGGIEYHGLLNFRWPYKRYTLYCPTTLRGTLSSLSFVKDDMVYQILRFQPGKAIQPPPPPPPINPGSQRLASQAPPPPPPPFLPRPWPPTTSGLPPKPWDYDTKIIIGGIMKFSIVSAPAVNPPHVIECKDKAISCHIPDQFLRLNFELFLNGQKEELSIGSPSQSNGTEIDMVIEKAFKLEPGKPTVIVGRFSLRSEIDSPFNNINLPLPSSEELVEYLGATEASESATDRVWSSRIDLNADIDDDDFCTSAACLEQILGVTSVPMRRYWKTPPSRPVSSNSSTSSFGEAEINHGPDETSLGEQATMTKPENDEKGDKDAEAGPSRDEGGKGASIRATAQGGIVSNPQEPPASDGPAPVAANMESAIAGLGNLTCSPTDDVTKVTCVVDPAQSNIPNSDISSLTKPNPGQLSEAALIGPEISSTYLPPPSPQGEPLVRSLAMDDPDMGIALLCGILGNQWVDVQRSFWQIRYLVKAHNFLATQESRSENPPEVSRGSSTLEESASFEKVRTSYLNRIKFHIHHSVVWIARAKLPCGYHVRPSVSPYNDITTNYCDDRDYDRALYPPIVIWYVIRNCSEALPPVFWTTLADCMHHLVNQEYGDVDITSSDHEPKLAILLWYRYSCLAQIALHLNSLPESMETSPNPNQDDTVFLPSAVDIAGFMSKSRTWQKRAEKAMASSRRAAVDSYSDQNESADRLTFLGVELGLTKEDEMKRPSSCLSQARRRIIDRKPSLSLNPGAPLFGQDGSVRVSTSAPWELTCVNHHIRLMLWKDPDLEDGLYSARKNCLRYESTNFLFIGSWDTSKPSITASFWDLDASCMICATFLDMRIKNESSELPLDSAAPESPGMNPPRISRRRPSIAVDTEIPNEGFAVDGAKPRGEPHGKRDFWDENVVELLRKQIETQDTLIQTLTKQSDNAFEFDWTRCEPPVPFHPDTWVQSLDDTPELFRATETRTVHLRNDLERYLHGPSPQGRDTSLSDASDWTADNISDRFTADELLFISTYDIGLLDGAYGERQVIGRLEPLRNILVDGIPKHSYEFSCFFGFGKLETNLGMWVAYLDCYLGMGPKFQELPDSLKRRYNELGPWLKGAIVTEDVILATKTQVREKLLARLSDSLVDCDTHNRIFFVQRCSRSIVKAFIYMWHRQSIDTFDDHFRNTSNFSDSKSDTWITSITISYWGFKVKYGANHELFQEPRDTAPFPPMMVSRWHRFKAKNGSKKSKAGRSTESPAKYIVEGSSSLVISGDKSGRWWTCSVISSVLPEATMRRAMINSTTTLTEFIHQPSSGRCLVFLSFLGALCEHLSLEYERILDELTQAINLGREVLKKGLDWTHAEDAIQRLKSMLWALEALRIFDDRLGESLDMVREARDKMRTYLSHGPGRRHDQLERQCQILLEEFDKQHGRLISVHVKIEQKINQISRYREGISAVSNLEDTHTALKQNDTIRILTYITIAYLPLSFIATVFSMSIVTESNWGPNLFGGLIIIFFISTLVLAKSLGLIIRSWDGLVKIIRTKLGIHDELDLEEMMDQAEEGLKKEKDDIESDSEGEAGSSTAVHRKGPMAFVRNLRIRKKISRKNSADNSLP